MRNSPVQEDGKRSPERTRDEVRGKMVGLWIAAPLDRRLLAEFLRGLALQVRDLSFGGVQADDDRALSLILADASGGRRGLDQIRYLKARAEPLYLPALLFLPQAGSAEPWLKAGFDDVVRVPVSKAELRARVEAHLRLRERTEALALSEARYRQLVENALVGIWQADAAGRLVFINQALSRMTGYARKEVMGRRMTEFISPELRSWLEERMRSRLSGLLDPDVVEVEMVRKDGSRFAALAAPGALFDREGHPVGFLGAMIDITERKHLEEEELEAFVYSVSHDLRAPLRAMEGFSQALLEDFVGVLPSQGMDYARRIRDAARRMDQLIQDLLTYSRLSRKQIRPRAVDLNRVLEEVLDQLEDEIRRRGAEVSVIGPLPVVRGHHTILVQVVTNLLANAVTFVPSGAKPKVTIRSQESDQRIRIWVEDNGIGIPPEHHQRIFRIFERLHGVEAYPGTGIGLAIVKKGVERLGGQVGVESREGEGSRFWVELPIADPRDQNHQSET